MAKNFVWWIKDELDAAAMSEAAKILVGRHDSDRSPRRRKARNNRPRWRSSTRWFEDGDLICFRIGASHFLWKMVRRITGMLAEVGRGDLTYDGFERLLKFHSDAPAKLPPRHPDCFWRRCFIKAISRPYNDKPLLR